MVQTKDKILDATVSFLKDNSNYEQLTLSKIAQKANIGKSTVYDYFKSKDQLVEETSLFILKQYETSLFEDLNAKTFKAAFKEQIKRIIDVIKDARIISDALFTYRNENINAVNSEKILTKINFLQDLFSERFKDIFTLAVKENLITTSSSNENIKYVMVSVITGLIHQYLHKRINLNEDELITLMEKQCLIIINHN